MFILWLLSMYVGDPPLSIYQTATVSETQAEPASSSVTIIGREQIVNSGARTLADVLWQVPGVAITEQHNGFTSAAIRGGDGNFTRVMIDGVPVNNLAYQVGGMTDLSGLPASMIERVEVVRGPLSSAYGSTGLAGVVHVITRADDGGWSGEIGGGDADSRQAAVRVSLADGRHQIAAGYRNEEGRVADESLEGLWLRAHASWLLGNTSLAITGRVSDRDQVDYADASGGPLFGDGTTRLTDHRETGLGFSLDFGTRMPQKIIVSAFRHTFERNSPAIFPLVPASEEDIRYTETRAVWNADILTNDKWTVSVGLDAARQVADNRSALDFGFPVPGDYRLGRNMFGASVDASLRAGEATWEFTARLDSADDHESFNPRIGYLRPLNDHVNLGASAGRAFKLPDFFALASPAALGGNPELQPEISTGGDLGLDGRWQALQAGTTVFFNRFEDLVDFDFATFLHVNRSEVRTRGIESYLRWQPDGPFSAGMTLTWQDVDLVGEDVALRHRPDWQGYGHLTWRPDDGLLLRLDTRYKGSIRDEQIPVPDRTEVDGYWLSGFSAEVKLWRDVSGRLRLDNLTDHNYEHLIGFPGGGRSWLVTIHSSF